MPGYAGYASALRAAVARRVATTMMLLGVALRRRRAPPLITPRHVSIIAARRFAIFSCRCLRF